MWSIKYFVRKTQGKSKSPLLKMHQAAVINKPRLNIIGVKGYGCTIKVVMLRWCPNITSTAKRQFSILTFKSKLLWRERNLSLLYFLYLGDAEMLDQNWGCLSFLLSRWQSKMRTHYALHISAYHPNAPADDQIRKRKYCCSGNLAFLVLSLNMN